MAITLTPTRSTRSLRALMIDDDAFMRGIVGDLLQELGVHDVKSARDGREGFEMFERAAVKPDVMLCDLNMPGTDGFEFMELVAERGYKGGIILITGMDARTRSSASLMARFHRLNVLATIGKPVDRDELAAALAKAA